MRLVLLIIFIASFIKAEELRADESAKIDDIFVESRRRETEIKDFLVANENTKVAEIKPELKAKIDSFFKKENSVLLLMFELNDRKVNISDFRLMLLKRVYLYTKEIAIKWENINTLSFLTIIELLLATKDEELTKDILSYFERVPNPSFDLKNPGWDHFKLVGGFKGSFATVLLQSNQEVIDKHMRIYNARNKSF
ncbi:MAG: hypothetical protein HRT88_19545 [Lentisphaeraceae bacterium]|nr:hypothetical protein [Lentisphaeraceae bacterium]